MIASSVTRCSAGMGQIVTRWCDPPTCRVAAMAMTRNAVAAVRNARKRRAGVHGREIASRTTAVASCTMSRMLNATRDRHVGAEYPVDDRHPAECRGVEVPHLDAAGPRATASPRRPGCRAAPRGARASPCPTRGARRVMPAMSGCHGRPARRRKQREASARRSLRRASHAPITHTKLSLSRKPRRNAAHSVSSQRLRPVCSHRHSATSDEHAQERGDHVRSPVEARVIEYDRVGARAARAAARPRRRRARGARTTREAASSRPRSGSTAGGSSRR